MATSVDNTFGQSSPLMAFGDHRPPSSGNGTERNNGLKSVQMPPPTPPQMYTTDAPMATEEFTGTTTMNSSPSKMPNTGRSNISGNNPNAIIRKKGLPWVVCSMVCVILLLLIIIAYLAYKMYGEEQIEYWSTIPTPSPVTVQISTEPPSSVANEISPIWQAADVKSWKFAKAAVVSENALCSEIGRSVLLKGGNAVDAAIAVATCIGALNSHSSGLGGGFLMTYYQRFYGKCTSIDARETAPSKTNKDIFNANPSDANRGYKSVAVPGEVHGLWTAFKRFGSGKIAWMDLLMPTVNLLNEGYPVTKLKEINLRLFEQFIINGTFPGMRDQFLNPATGELYKEGEIVRNPTLADTLKRLALSHDPIQLFYSANGEIAKAMVEEFAQNGGFITRKDLHTYRSFVDEQPLLNTEAHPKWVFCGPKPSSGFALTQLILAIMLKFYPPGSNASIPSNSVEYWHRLIEAQKYAYAWRTKLGDGLFQKESVELALNMTKKEFVDSLVKKIGTKASNFSASDFLNIGEAFLDDEGTSQVVVVDADGNAISMTNSINRPFGSLVRSPRLGIIWNGHMGDFSVPHTLNNSYGLAPARANFIEPGKRPMSSMSPMIVYDRETRKVKAAIGASGGPKIPSAIGQVLSQVLSFNHGIRQSIDGVRLHNQFTPFQTQYEKEFPKQFLDALRERGQQLAQWNFPYSFVQAIVRDEEKEGNGKEKEGREYLTASNDHRRQVHSHPVGY